MTTLRYISQRIVKFLPAIALAATLGFASLAQAQQRPARLIMVSVGISQYQNPKANLRSAAKDATDMARAFSAQRGKLFSRVDVKLFTDHQATASNIRSALQWASSSADFDTYVVVYLAGHGNNGPSGDFFFTAHDYNPHDQAQTSVTWREFQNSLNGLPGKAMLILDSCRSGAVSNTSNLIVLSSSLANQDSGESAQNGYFTQAFIEALSGKADVNKNGIVTLAEMDAYVSGRVEQISGGKQLTTVSRPANIPSNLPLASLIDGIVTVTGPPASGPSSSTFTSSGPIATGPVAANPTIVPATASTFGDITSSGPINMPNPVPVQQAFQSSGPLR